MRLLCVPQRIYRVKGPVGEELGRDVRDVGVRARGSGLLDRASDDRLDEVSFGDLDILLEVEDGEGNFFFGRRDAAGCLVNA